MKIEVPISVGELVDKISILEIKMERIGDPKKVAAVGLELEALQSKRKEFNNQKTLEEFLERLKVVNGKLWDVEDKIRQKEKESDFGQEFITLARSVYLTNDERSRIKHEINVVFGSEITEVKGYV